MARWRGRTIEETFVFERFVSFRCVAVFTRLDFRYLTSVAWEQVLDDDVEAEESLRSISQATVGNAEGGRFVHASLEMRFVVFSWFSSLGGALADQDMTPHL